jgi:hypothetical protein
MNWFGRYFQFFWGHFPFFGGGNLLGAVSIFLGVISTFLTTVPFNWGHDSTLHEIFNSASFLTPLISF